MTYDLTPEQRKLSDEVRDFADTVVAPAAYEYDTRRELPYEIIAQMGEMGLFGLPFPDGVRRPGPRLRRPVPGGRAAQPRRPVDRGDARGRASGSGAMPVWRSGTEAQKQEWIPMLAQGTGARGLRADGGRRRVGRGRHEDDRAARG